MNTTSKLSLKVLAVAALSSLALQANAGDQSTYRRVVLGQSDAVSQPAGQEAQAAPKLVPGSYARYLMVVNGKSESQAVEEARQAGEQLVWQTSAPVRDVAMTGFERYQRAMGISTVRKGGA